MRIRKTDDVPNMTLRIGFFGNSTSPIGLLVTDKLRLRGFKAEYVDIGYHINYASSGGDFYVYIIRTSTFTCQYVR